ncbi:MAG: dethiobiotin synthase [Leptolyngbyaceae bacterium]|nr:dethiobiotin synthase [Leptolyngbyaceae bacterium]
MNALLITGTDTDTGKTVLTTALAAYWQTYCATSSLGILKPIQSGVGDRELYRQLFFRDQSLESITPLFFEAPLAPPIAAQREGRKVELEKAWQALEALRQQRDWVLVEALGGLGSPVTSETTVADLAWDWRLPTVLVVPVRLGAIAQAVANVALARQCRVHLKGIVLNCVQPRSDQEIEDWTPPELIESLTHVPVLGIIPYLVDPTDITKLVQVASNLDLERLLPFGLSSRLELSK